MTSAVVVTGAGGFIGSALVTALREQGRKVVTVGRSADDLIAAGPPGLAVLVHLGENSDIARANARGDAHIAETVQRCKTLLAHDWGHVVYGSSAAVYGDAQPQPRRPDEVVVPTTPYAAAKLACEALVLAKGGTVLRFANVIGKGMNTTTVLGALLRQIPGTGPVQVRSLAPKRDFIWIDDTVSAIVAAITAGPPAVFNVGSGAAVTIRHLVSLMLDIVGENGRPVIETAGGVSVLALDISATLASLNWMPRTSLQAGLTELIRASV